MKKKTGLVFFPAFDYAISPTHPEREERLLYTQDQVFEEGLLDFDNIVEFKPRLATAKDIQRVHVCAPNIEAVTEEAHLIATGGCLVAADNVMQKKVDNAFALVRPPGHHTFRIVHGPRGFCNLNFEAIMVEYIRHTYGVKKIAVVDTDCHHGDGSQDIFWNDPNTLYISIHQDGRTLYPGSGFYDEIGGPNAYGLTCNIPVPPGTGEEGFLHALNEIIMPMVEEFQPDLIINSAGQDNHYSDPITNMNFTAQGYALLNDRLKPDIAVLEGGYSIESALPYVNLGIILAMAGMDYSQIREPDYDPAKLKQDPQITRYMSRITEACRDNWRTRKSAAEKMFAGKQFHESQRQIYYDTAQLREYQKETVRICPDCGGTSVVESRTDHGAHIKAVMVPRYSCDPCRKWGEEQFDGTDKNIKQVFYQDKDKDLYIER